MGPATTDPFFGERIESTAVLLGLKEDGEDGEVGGESPEPHAEASRAKAISADPIKPLRSITVSLVVLGSSLERLPEPSGEMGAVPGRHVEHEGP